jgi:glycosyltransferase involved in cell wall biosynthesis
VTAPDPRPRIALVVDSPGWAFDNIAQRVSAHLADEFSFQTHYQADYEWPDAYRIIPETLGAGYDLVHFFWRLAPVHMLLDEVFLPSLLVDESLDEIVDRYLAQPVTISVHDHLFLEPELAERRRLLFSTCGVGYHVSSQRLDRIYREFGDMPPPDAVIEDGVDLEMFGPVRLERLADRDREIVVGWAGNSRWNRDDEAAIDYKGLDTIIKPAVESLRSRGVPVVGRYRDRAEAWWPYEEVPSYFAGLDVYLCASLIEGTATPVLEAMACGLPVISTDVGIVPQLFGPLQREFLLPERSVEAFGAAIERLASDPELRVALSQENLERIQAWTWEATAERWRGFFRQILAHGWGISPERQALADPVVRRERLRGAVVDSLQNAARFLLDERRILVESDKRAATLLGRHEADSARLIKELDDARRWAQDVEGRLAGSRSTRQLGRQFARQLVRGSAARVRAVARRPQS